MPIRFLNQRGDAMNKLLSVLLAGAAALALSGVAVAADQSQAAQPGSDQGGMTTNQQSQTPSQAQPSSDQGGMTKNENQAGADVSAKDQEYLAGLKKCESLEGDQKQKCIDAAKKKAGEM
jgi:opacity protein-like surface antigen